MKILFAGTPAFAAGYLSALIESDHELMAVITQPDKPGKRGKKLIPSAVKVTAENAGIPVLQPEKLTVEDLAPFSVDLMVVVAYGQILKPAVLAYPRLGCINVHASLLPRWRGAAPVQRAIMAGDETSGITLIQMNAGLDTGDMLAKAPVTISQQDTAADLFEKLSHAGHPLLIETLTHLANDTATPQVQDDANALYAKKIGKQEALIDWSQGATTVDRLIRAMNPEPIAYTFLDTLRVKVHQGVVEQGRHGEPGAILEVSKAGVLVGCGADAFRISRIQLPLGKGGVLSGNDVLNGWTNVLQDGCCFGAAP